MVTTSPILITGASGFLGSYLCAHLERSGESVIGVDRIPSGQRTCVGAGIDPVQTGRYVLDLADAARVGELLARVKPRAVLHCAGPASVEASLQWSDRQRLEQLEPLRILIDAMARTLAPDVKFVLMSSAAVYGAPDRLPIREDAACHPVSPYGLHKLEQERLVRPLAVAGDRQVCCMRIFSTYGPGQQRLAVYEIARRALSGDFSLLGTGEEIRDFIFVGRLAHAIECVLRSADFGGEVLNVGSGVGTRLSAVARRIYELLGLSESPVCRGVAEPGKPSAWIADVSAISNLGFARPATWDEGLEETIGWIVDD